MKEYRVYIGSSPDYKGKGLNPIHEFAPLYQPHFCKPWMIPSSAYEIVLFGFDVNSLSDTTLSIAGV